MEGLPVQCPTCFEWFEIQRPPDAELPVELDYDCEVCCRPMVITVDREGAQARGLDD